MCQSLPIYEYAALDGDNEIRTLELQTAQNFSDPLLVRLHIRKIEPDEEHTLGSFDAVSYCWGAPGDYRWIQCNDRRLEVRADVDTMLRYLRKTTRLIALWIDALCINQSDVEEKAKQVRNMGRIYSYANKVHVWLGEAHEDDQIPATFSLLRRKALASQETRALQQYPKAAMTDTGVKLLAKFLSRPWFRRRWVLQEVALSHDVTIHCGHHKLSWDWAGDGLKRFQSDLGEELRIIPLEAVHALENMTAVRSKNRDIFELLSLCHSSECMDARDRLFSLYSMVSKDKKDELDPYICFPVDHSKDWVSIYTEFATACVQAGFVHVLLFHIRHFGTLSVQHPAFPSWIPSYNKQRIFRLQYAKTQGNPLRPSSLTVELLGATPGLRIQGQLFSILQYNSPIRFPDIYPNEIQGSSSSFGLINQVQLILDKFKEAANPPSFPPVRPIVVTLARLLLSAIMDTQNCYNGEPVDFGVIFGDSHEVNYHGLLPFLKLASTKNEFGVLLPDQGSLFSLSGRELLYNGVNLHKEVNRILKGYTVFRLNESESSFGITLCEVKSGDAFYLPRNLYGLEDYLGFILCPYEDPSGPDMSGLQKFCIVGSCHMRTNVNLWQEKSQEILLV